MKILVTGGAGFIGSHVVDAYIAAGHEVLVVDNLSTGSVHHLHPRARFFLMDITHPDIETLVMQERPEVINHHAAHVVVHQSVADPVQDARINLMGTLHVLRAAARAGVRKIIYASTGGAIYGETSVPVDEDAPPRPQSPYGLSKWTGELYLRWFAQEHGIAFTVLRYANVYGPRQVAHGEAGVVATFIQTLMEGGTPTLFHYPEEPEGMLRDYVFVGDVAEANCLALERGDGAILNIATGRGVRTLTLYRMILHILREEGVDIPEDRENPLRKPARPGDLRANILSWERARRILGWTPRVSLEEGLRHTVRAFLRTSLSQQPPSPCE